MPLGTVICLDAADFVSVSGDTPRFEISDQATLHMEDTTRCNSLGWHACGRLQLRLQSMFQTDRLALRLILPMNWTCVAPASCRGSAA